MDGTTKSSPPTDPLIPFRPLRASTHLHDGKHHLLLACTGSVATIKLPVILSALSHYPNISIRVLLTPSAAHFLLDQSAEQPHLSTLLDIPHVDAIYLDEHEWVKPWVRGADILHIELRRWADLMVIAPLSADALAKIANGFADGLVTSVVRAWDVGGWIDPPRDVGKEVDDWEKRESEKRDDSEKSDEVEAQFDPARRVQKRIVVAPAMNTAMWNHSITKKHIEILEGEWNVENGGWFEVLRPVEKTLACGDTGSGAMRDWKEIVSVIEDRLSLQKGG